MASGASKAEQTAGSGSGQQQQQNYPKLALKAVRIECVLLILLALAIVGLQVNNNQSIQKDEQLNNSIIVYKGVRFRDVYPSVLRGG